MPQTRSMDPSSLVTPKRPRCDSLRIGGDAAFGDELETTPFPNEVLQISDEEEGLPARQEPQVESDAGEPKRFLESLQEAAAEGGCGADFVSSEADEEEGLSVRQEPQVESDAGDQLWAAFGPYMESQMWADDVLGDVFLSACVVQGE